MAEESDLAIFVDNKDQIIIRPSKRTIILTASRAAWLFMATIICVFYVYTNGLKQIGNINFFASMQHPLRQICNTSYIPREEIPYFHFPEPLTYKREECYCNPVRFFAILSTQRSGSGWFETLLNSHINVSSNGEIFSVKERRANISSIISSLDQVYNLDWFSSASKNECLAAVGFKWMLNRGLMVNHEEIVDYFNKKGVSAIFLFRRNHLSRLVSLLSNTYDRESKQINGTHKSHVHSKNDHDSADVLARYKPQIDTSKLLQDLQYIDEFTNNATIYFKSTRHIVVYYEDLVTNKIKLYEIQKFLWLPKMKLRSRQVKIHTKPLSEHVENWQDVYNTLKGTQYEHFLTLD